MLLRNSVRTLLCVHVCISLYPEMELLGHTVAIFNSEELPCHFLKELRHFTFPQSMPRGSGFSTSLMTFVINLPYLLEPSWVYPSGFGLHFPDPCDFGIFSCAY